MTQTADDKFGNAWQMSSKARHPLADPAPEDLDWDHDFKLAFKDRWPEVLEQCRLDNLTSTHSMPPSDFERGMGWR